MEPISNADRLVLLLRRKLEERAKATSSRAAAKPERSVAARGTSAVHALAAIEGADERALRRTVIQHILAEELGPDLVNDAQFQQVVTRVTDAIDEDRGGAQLLSDVLASRRKS